MARDSENRSWIKAQWGAPPWIKAGISTRNGGHSQSPFNSLNVAMHVGDNPETVGLNRKYLRDLLALPAEPVWLDQIHGNKIIQLGEKNNPQADGSYTNKSGVVCAIMTADCIPVLLCDTKGTIVAAVHVGWRGYCAGIIAKVLGIFSMPKSDILVWIGPHISASNYEVGDDVYHSCVDRDRGVSKFFTKSPSGRWYANLEMMVQHELMADNVTNITSSNSCTFRLNADFFSYRRDNITGRMASMIWIDK